MLSKYSTGKLHHQPQEFPSPPSGEREGEGEEEGEREGEGEEEREISHCYRDSDVIEIELPFLGTGLC
jgi:hypothetical protein